MPLIANWRGTIPPGQVLDHLVDVSDFLPTLAEATAGVAAVVPDRVKIRNSLDGEPVILAPAA